MQTMSDSRRGLWTLEDFIVLEETLTPPLSHRPEPLHPSCAHDPNRPENNE
jgi:hypothetical protein